LFSEISETLKNEVYPLFYACAREALKWTIFSGREESASSELRGYVEKELNKATEQIKKACDRELKHEKKIFRDVQERLKKHLSKGLYPAIERKGVPYSPDAWFDLLRDEILARFSGESLLKIFDADLFKKGFEDAVEVLALRKRDPVLSQIYKTIIDQAKQTSATSSQGTINLVKEIQLDFQQATEMIEQRKIPTNILVTL